MNMAADFAIVAELLETFRWKQHLRRAIQTGRPDEIEQVVSRQCAADRYSVSALVNDIYDKRFSTPLHLAVETSSVHVLSMLLHLGATPVRNSDGNLPWERFALPRLSVAAAVARSAGRLKSTNCDKGLEMTLTSRAEASMKTKPY